MRRVALLSLLAPLALVACGGSHPAASLGRPVVVRNAILKTVSAPSLHFAATFHGSRAGSGDVDNARHIVRLVSTHGTT